MNLDPKVLLDLLGPGYGTNYKLRKNLDAYMVFYNLFSAGPSWCSGSSRKGRKHGPPRTNGSTRDQRC